jgi:hypothetical protein
MYYLLLMQAETGTFFIRQMMSRIAVCGMIIMQIIPIQEDMQTAFISVALKSRFLSLKMNHTLTKSRIFTRWRAFIQWKKATTTTTNLTTTLTTLTTILTTTTIKWKECD